MLLGTFCGGNPNDPHDRGGDCTPLKGLESRSTKVLRMAFLRNKFLSGVHGFRGGHGVLPFFYGRFANRDIRAFRAPNKDLSIFLDKTTKFCGLLERISL